LIISFLFYIILLPNPTIRSYLIRKEVRMPLSQVGWIILGTFLSTLTGVGLFQNNQKLVKFCAVSSSLVLLATSVASVI
jgi:hypothetical protein